MWESAALFVVFVAALTVLIRAGAVWMGRIAGRRIRRRFQEAEHILETGRAPEVWLAETHSLPDERKRQSLLKRLDALAEFYRTSPVVADEATRELLLGRLRGVRRRWEQTGP